MKKLEKVKYTNLLFTRDGSTNRDRQSKKQHTQNKRCQAFYLERKTEAVSLAVD